MLDLFNWTDLIKLFELLKNLSNSYFWRRFILEPTNFVGLTMPQGHRYAGMITFDGKVVHGSTLFRYLGSIVHKDGDLDGDGAHRIKARLLKWMSATWILCDRDMPHLKDAEKLDLVRFIASEKPALAAVKVSEKIAEVIKSLMLVHVPTKGFAASESMHLALENIVGTIFDESNEYSKKNTESQISIQRTLEGLLQQLISLKWTEPTLVEVLGRYLDAMGPFLKYYPDAVGSVINKLFELLTSLPFMVKDPSTSTARRARLQICTSFIRLAKAANESLLPHMKKQWLCLQGIASTMSYLQTEGVLLRAEQNLLGEAFLVMASSAGVEQQQEVLLWLLEPLSKQWTQPEWQEAYLNDPASLVRLCADTQFMWSIFHTVTFFERALKRSGFRKGSLSSEQNLKAYSLAPHPMVSHLLWMLPPLLKLLRAIHSLWFPSIAQALLGEMRAAMNMSDVERTSLLGEGKHNFLKGALTFSDGSQLENSKEGLSEPSETDIRNWLRGIRDSGTRYSILGLCATLGDSFFRYVDPHSVIVALMENIQYMEFRHIKQLVHLVLVPVLKYCPLDLREVWLEKLLHPLLLHTSEALNCSWYSLLQEGKAKVPDLRGIISGSDLKVEVMEEKLLRDLTREICSLLSALASPGLNDVLPSLEQAGQMSYIDDSSKIDLKAFACGSMVGFLLNKKSLALPVLKICIEAFRWTDSEAMSKVSSFCGLVILLAISTNNLELREFVCKDLFSAIIHGLTLESNAFISADLVGLCREIFIYLSDGDPSPRQILLSLPCITLQDLHAFEEALSKTGSPKEQKQHMKNLLIMATGSKLKALATQKGVNVITNVTRLAGRSIKYPRGIIEDVLIKVDKFVFPVDFIILDMDEDQDIPIILGRPFLATGRALIDVEERKLILRVQDKQVIFNILETLKNPPTHDYCLRIDAIEVMVNDSLEKILSKDPAEEVYYC
ncbi:histone deacetylase [Orobanche gracilis]